VGLSVGTTIAGYMGLCPTQFTEVGWVSIVRHTKKRRKLPHMTRVKPIRSYRWLKITMVEHRCTKYCQVLFKIKN
jgi:hypothetical protein